MMWAGETKHHLETLLIEMDTFLTMLVILTHTVSHSHLRKTPISDAIFCSVS